ncbi:MAG TPA: hypothetical protein GXX19_01880 [Syntrophomonadaceae bacterium]|nr:hypothetical protein [Syntrophomonadaceae bacterium]
MNWQRWTFRALDTCFFRNSSPFNSGEGGYTTTRTIFPPTMFTIQGAIRTSLALERGWLPGEERLWPKELGGPNDLGELKLRGPYLCFEDQPYFSMPLLLLEKDGDFTRLLPGEQVECDLGYVSLPVPQRPIEGAKVPEGCYISRDGLAAVLEGGTPTKKDTKRSDELWVEESRIGLERQDTTRTALEGHLYNCVHIRPRPKVKLVVFVLGIPGKWQVSNQRILSLGGESRLAAVEVEAGEPAQLLPPPPHLTGGQDGKLRFTVTLITPGCYGELEDVERVICEGPPGVPGRCISACIGKVQQIGGWDLLNRQPRSLISVVPPGSTWFYEGDPQYAEEITKLHGQCLSSREAYGFGQIVIGKWEEEKK